MAKLSAVLRVLSRVRFRVLRLAIIEDIPTEKFNQLLVKHVKAGWHKSNEYEGFDAWIDYGRVVLRKGWTKLEFKWDNWTEGEIVGPRNVVNLIAEDNGLKAQNRPSWLSSEK